MAGDCQTEHEKRGLLVQMLETPQPQLSIMGPSEGQACPLCRAHDQGTIWLVSFQSCHYLPISF
jgi:hypothetical protein